MTILSDTTINGNLKVSGKICQSGYITATLTNGWAAYTSTEGLLPPQYMKDSLGYVHIKGNLYNGSIEAPAFKLPVGYYIPSNHCLFCVLSDDDHIGKIIISLSGNVYIQNFSVTSIILLGEIIFKVEN